MKLRLENASELLQRRARERDAARAEVEAANRAKDDFMAVLSHELRTPLNAMLGWIHLIRRGSLMPDQRDRALDAIERNTRVQSRLIEDLLDVSSIIAGKLRLNVRALDLPHVVEAALDAARPTAHGKGVDVDARLDPDAPPVSGDPDRLQQVVGNLLSNAVKFTPRGGRVEVRLERHGSGARIVVQDSGEGMSRDDRPAPRRAPRRHGRGAGKGRTVETRPCHHRDVSRDTMLQMLDIPGILATELSLQPFQVANALELFASGATVPFIARYRKERTGEMNEIQLRELSDRFAYLTELEDRKRAVLESIAEQGKLTHQDGLVHISQLADRFVDDRVRRAQQGGQGMRGVQFLVDEKGQKTGVVIDLRKNPDLWEDLFDRALAKKRRSEPRENFDAVKRRLIKAGKLRSRASA